MKQQTFIVKGYDRNGIQKDFYRFCCKKNATVKKQFNDIVNSSMSNFWLRSWNNDNIVYFTCFATPDGYSETEAVWTITLKELFNL